MSKPGWYVCYQYTYKEHPEYNTCKYSNSFDSYESAEEFAKQKLSDSKWYEIFYRDGDTVTEYLDDKKEIIITYCEEHSDSTRLYTISLKRTFTIGEFIDAILKNRPNEFGAFGFKYQGLCIIGDVLCEFNKGKITSDTPPRNILNSKIKEVTGYGGYGYSAYLFEIGV